MTRTVPATDISEAVRKIVAQHGRLSAGVAGLKDTSNLYDAGLTSLATVGLMLALENHFNVEYSEAMLGRKTYQSIESIAEALGELTGEN